MAGWLCWRVLVSRHHVLDAWIVWTSDVLFVIGRAARTGRFRGRVIGRGEAYRVAVLVPLYNEDPDVVVRMLSALLHGRTVQQPSAFAFAWMPDRWSHHYRQQERWFRGSFIRGLWRIRFLPVLSWGWWRQATGWMQIWLVISVFVYLLLWRPLVLGSGVPPTVVLVPLAIGLAQGSRYISVWRSDTTGPQRYASLLLSPVATLWSALILRPLRVWGMVTSANMGWNTRQQVEVTSL